MIFQIESEIGCNINMFNFECLGLYLQRTRRLARLDTKQQRLHAIVLVAKRYYTLILTSFAKMETFRENTQSEFVHHNNS